jgi:hypothetical protein
MMGVSTLRKSNRRVPLSGLALTTGGGLSSSRRSKAASRKRRVARSSSWSRSRCCSALRGMAWHVRIFPLHDRTRNSYGGGQIHQRMPRLSACRGSAAECAGVTAPITSESSGGVLMLLRELLELLALRQVRPPAAATIALAAA